MLRRRWLGGGLLNRHLTETLRDCSGALLTKIEAKDAEGAKQLIAFGESKADPELAPVDLAAWTLVANLLLNLDEVVNKN